ncbi:MAG: DUF5693 family protein [bacterium]
MLWTLIFSYIKAKSDRNQNSVEIAFSFNELKDNCQKKQYLFESALMRLSALNIKTAVVKEIFLDEWLKEHSLIICSTKDDLLYRLIKHDVGDINAQFILYTTDKTSLINLTSFLETFLKRPVKIIEKETFAFLPLNERDVWVLEHSPLGVSPEQIRFLNKYSMNALVEINAEKWGEIDIDDKKMDEAYFFDKTVKSVLVRGKSFIGYHRYVRNAAKYLISRSLLLVKLEFYTQRGLMEAARLMSNFVVPAHDLILPEGQFNIYREKLIARFMRAVRERSVHMVIIHPFEDSSIEEDFLFWRTIIRSLSKAGYNVDSSLPYYRTSSSLITVQQIFAIILALFVPIFSLILLIRLVKTELMIGQLFIIVFLLTNIVTVIGAINIYSILSTYEFTSRIYQFRGVKIALLLPVFTALYILFNGEEWRRFINYELKVKHIVYFSVISAVIFVVIARSGNLSIIPVSAGESLLREGLENIFLIRPRFKEFLFGHPLLLFGIWIWVTRGRKSQFSSKAGRIMIGIGLIGQTSIINTFTHAHTPIVISLIRTANGLVLGFIFGILLIVIYKFMPKLVSIIKEAFPKYS